MRSRSRRWAQLAWAVLLLLAGALEACNGCPGRAPCNLTGHRVSTRVIKGNITAPPGGPATREFEVLATGFHPNAQANLGIINYPKESGNILVSVTMDGAGSLRWTRFAPILLPTDPSFDPAVDVTTTLAEVATTCFAVAKSKHGDFGL